MCACRFVGRSTAHCAACHETFNSVSAFDEHQRLARENTGLRVVCLDPRTAVDRKGSQIFTVAARTGYWGTGARFPDAAA